MKILITGARGLIGSSLVPYLERNGHEVSRLVRRSGRRLPGDIVWDPSGGSMDRKALEGFEGVIHLAGENLGAGRWTEARKRELRESRLGTTRLLSESLAELRRPPRVLISASAVGYYGDRGDEVLTESSSGGRGFLADLARDWEDAAGPARRSGIRVVHPRLGMVLTRRGGALPKLLLPFRLGLGGRFGSGDQWMSWVLLDDLLAALLHLLVQPGAEGPYNVAAPGPVRNREFARVLGRALSRPAVLGLPSFALKLLMGEMAKEMLLGGARVVPARLEAEGYAFVCPDLEGALRRALEDAPCQHHAAG